MNPSLSNNNSQTNLENFLKNLPPNATLGDALSIIIAYQGQRQMEWTGWFGCPGPWQHPMYNDEPSIVGDCQFDMREARMPYDYYGGQPRPTSYCREEIPGHDEDRFEDRVQSQRYVDEDFRGRSENHRFSDNYSRGSYLAEVRHAPVHDYDYERRYRSRGCSRGTRSRIVRGRKRDNLFLDDVWSPAATDDEELLAEQTSKEENKTAGRQPYTMWNRGKRQPHPYVRNVVQPKSEKKKTETEKTSEAQSKDSKPSTSRSYDKHPIVIEKTTDEKKDLALKENTPEKQIDVESKDPKPSASNSCDENPKVAEKTTDKKKQSAVKENTLEKQKESKNPKMSISKAYDNTSKITEKNIDEKNKSAATKNSPEKQSETESKDPKNSASKVCDKTAKVTEKSIEKKTQPDVTQKSEEQKSQPAVTKNSPEKRSEAQSKEEYKNSTSKICDNSLKVTEKTTNEEKQLAVKENTSGKQNDVQSKDPKNSTSKVCDKASKIREKSVDGNIQSALKENSPEKRSGAQSKSPKNFTSKACDENPKVTEKSKDEKKESDAKESLPEKPNEAQSKDPKNSTSKVCDKSPKVIETTTGEKNVIEKNTDEKEDLAVKENTSEKQNDGQSKNSKNSTSKVCDKSSKKESAATENSPEKQSGAQSKDSRNSASKVCEDSPKVLKRNTDEPKQSAAKEKLPEKRNEAKSMNPKNSTSKVCDKSPKVIETTTDEKNVIEKNTDEKEDLGVKENTPEKQNDSQSRDSKNSTSKVCDKNLKKESAATENSPEKQSKAQSKDSRNSTSKVCNAPEVAKRSTDEPKQSAAKEKLPEKGNEAKSMNPKNSTFKACDKSPKVTEKSIDKKNQSDVKENSPENTSEIQSKDPKNSTPKFCDKSPKVSEKSIDDKKKSVAKENLSEKPNEAQSKDPKNSTSKVCDERLKIPEKGIEEKKESTVNENFSEKRNEAQSKNSKNSTSNVCEEIPKITDKNQTNLKTNINANQNKNNKISLNSSNFAIKERNKPELSANKLSKTDNTREKIPQENCVLPDNEKKFTTSDEKEKPNGQKEAIKETLNEDLHKTDLTQDHEKMSKPLSKKSSLSISSLGQKERKDLKETTKETITLSSNLQEKIGDSKAKSGLPREITKVIEESNNNNTINSPKKEKGEAGNDKEKKTDIVADNISSPRPVTAFLFKKELRINLIKKDFEIVSRSKKMGKSNESLIVVDEVIQIEDDDSGLSDLEIVDVENSSDNDTLKRSNQVEEIPLLGVGEVTNADNAPSTPKVKDTTSLFHTLKKDGFYSSLSSLEDANDDESLSSFENPLSGTVINTHASFLNVSKPPELTIAIPDNMNVIDMDLEPSPRFSSDADSNPDDDLERDIAFENDERMFKEMDALFQDSSKSAIVTADNKNVSLKRTKNDLPDISKVVKNCAEIRLKFLINKCKAIDVNKLVEKAQTFRKKSEKFLKNKKINQRRSKSVPAPEKSSMKIKNSTSSNYLNEVQTMNVSSWKPYGTTNYLTAIKITSDKHESDYKDDLLELLSSPKKKLPHNMGSHKESSEFGSNSKSLKYNSQEVGQHAEANQEKSYETLNNEQLEDSDNDFTLNKKCKKIESSTEEDEKINTKTTSNELHKGDSDDDFTVSKKCRKIESSTEEDDRATSNNGRRQASNKFKKHQNDKKLSNPSIGLDIVGSIISDMNKMKETTSMVDTILSRRNSSIDERPRPPPEYGRSPSGRRLSNENTSRRMSIESSSIRQSIESCKSRRSSIDNHSAKPQPQSSTPFLSKPYLEPISSSEDEESKMKAAKLEERSKRKKINKKQQKYIFGSDSDLGSDSESDLDKKNIKKKNTATNKPRHSTENDQSKTSVETDTKRGTPGEKSKYASSNMPISRDHAAKSNKDATNKDTDTYSDQRSSKKQHSIHLSRKQERKDNDLQSNTSENISAHKDNGLQLKTLEGRSADMADTEKNKGERRDSTKQENSTQANNTSISREDDKKIVKEKSKNKETETDSEQRSSKQPSNLGGSLAEKLSTERNSIKRRDSTKYENLGQASTSEAKTKEKKINKIKDSESHLDQGSSNQEKALEGSLVDKLGTEKNKRRDSTRYENPGQANGTSEDVKNKKETNKNKDTESDSDQRSSKKKYISDVSSSDKGNRDKNREKKRDSKKHKHSKNRDRETHSDSSHRSSKKDKSSEASRRKSSKDDGSQSEDNKARVKEQSTKIENKCQENYKAEDKLKISEPPESNFNKTPVQLETNLENNQENINKELVKPAVSNPPLKLKLKKVRDSPNKGTQKSSLAVQTGNTSVSSKNKSSKVVSENKSISHKTSTSFLNESTPKNEDHLEPIPKITLKRVPDKEKRKRSDDERKKSKKHKTASSSSNSSVKSNNISNARSDRTIKMLQPHNLVDIDILQTAVALTNNDPVPEYETARQTTVSDNSYLEVAISHYPQSFMAQSRNSESDNEVIFIDPNYPQIDLTDDTSERSETSQDISLELSQEEPKPIISDEERICLYAAIDSINDEFQAVSASIPGSAILNSALKNEETSEILNQNTEDANHTAMKEENDLEPVMNDSNMDTILNSNAVEIRVSDIHDPVEDSIGSLHNEENNSASNIVVVLQTSNISDIIDPATSNEQSSLPSAKENENDITNKNNGATEASSSECTLSLEKDLHELLSNLERLNSATNKRRQSNPLNSNANEVENIITTNTKSKQTSTPIDKHLEKDSQSSEKLVHNQVQTTEEAANQTENETRNSTPNQVLLPNEIQNGLLSNNENSNSEVSSQHNENENYASQSQVQNQNKILTDVVFLSTQHNETRNSRTNQVQQGIQNGVLSNNEYLNRQVPSQPNRNENHASQNQVQNQILSGVVSNEHSNIQVSQHSESINLSPNEVQHQTGIQNYLLSNNEHLNCQVSSQHNENGNHASQYQNGIQVGVLSNNKRSNNQVSAQHNENRHSTPNQVQHQNGIQNGVPFNNEHSNNQASSQHNEIGNHASQNQVQNQKRIEGVVLSSNKHLNNQVSSEPNENRNSIPNQNQHQNRTQNSLLSNNEQSNNQIGKKANEKSGSVQPEHVGPSPPKMLRLKSVEQINSMLSTNVEKDEINMQQNVGQNVTQSSAKTHSTPQVTQYVLATQDPIPSQRNLNTNINQAQFQQIVMTPLDWEIFVDIFFKRIYFVYHLFHANLEFYKSIKTIQTNPKTPTVCAQAFKHEMELTARRWKSKLISLGQELFKDLERVKIYQIPDSNNLYAIITSGFITQIQSKLEECGLRLATECIYLFVFAILDHQRPTGCLTQNLVISRLYDTSIRYWNTFQYHRIDEDINIVLGQPYPWSRQPLIAQSAGSQPLAGPSHQVTPAESHVQSGQPNPRKTSAIRPKKQVRPQEQLNQNNATQPPVLASQMPARTTYQCHQGTCQCNNNQMPSVSFPNQQNNRQTQKQQHQQNLVQNVQPTMSSNQSNFNQNLQTTYRPPVQFNQQHLEQIQAATTYSSQPNVSQNMNTYSMTSTTKPNAGQISQNLGHNSQMQVSTHSESNMGQNFNMQQTVWSVNQLNRVQNVPAASELLIQMNQQNSSNNSQMQSTMGQNFNAQPVRPSYQANINQNPQLAPNPSNSQMQVTTMVYQSSMGHNTNAHPVTLHYRSQGPPNIQVVSNNLHPYVLPNVTQINPARYPNARHLSQNSQTTTNPQVQHYQNLSDNPPLIATPQTLKNLQHLHQNTQMTAKLQAQQNSKSVASLPPASSVFPAFQAYQQPKPVCPNPTPLDKLSNMSVLGTFWPHNPNQTTASKSSFAAPRALPRRRMPTSPKKRMDTPRYRPNADVNPNQRNVYLQPSENLGNTPRYQINYDQSSNQSNVYLGTNASTKAPQAHIDSIAQKKNDELLKELLLTSQTAGGSLFDTPTNEKAGPSSIAASFGSTTNLNDSSPTILTIASKPSPHSTEESNQQNNNLNIPVENNSTTNIPSDTSKSQQDGRFENASNSSQAETSVSVPNSGIMKIGEVTVRRRNSVSTDSELKIHTDQNIAQVTISKVSKTVSSHQQQTSTQPTVSSNSVSPRPVDTSLKSPTSISTVDFTALAVCSNPVSLALTNAVASPLKLPASSPGPSNSSTRASSKTISATLRETRKAQKRPHSEDVNIETSTKKPKIYDGDIIDVSSDSEDETMNQPSDKTSNEKSKETVTGRLHIIETKPVVQEQEKECEENDSRLIINELDDEDSYFDEGPETAQAGDDMDDEDSTFVEGPEVPSQNTDSYRVRANQTTDNFVLPTIDLTLIPDFDLEQVQKDLGLVFVKKEEDQESNQGRGPSRQPQEPTPEQQEQVREQELSDLLRHQNENIIVVPSPADSGIASPPVQESVNEDARMAEAEKFCFCGNRAQYNCVCELSWYCGVDCQFADWENHKQRCSYKPEDADDDSEEEDT